ncbi:hypothetical protein MPLA_740029 [Mesorhizobium sp. ORS 3359]|nr:hypothetical protein MPLA_740029 [Mesorhizobium sp. ORS 3359]
MTRTFRQRHSWRFIRFAERENFSHPSFAIQPFGLLLLPADCAQRVKYQASVAISK